MVVIVVIGVCGRILLIDIRVIVVILGDIVILVIINVVVHFVVVDFS